MAIKSSDTIWIVSCFNVLPETNSSLSTVLASLKSAGKATSLILIVSFLVCPQGRLDVSVEIASRKSAFQVKLLVHILKVTWKVAGAVGLELAEFARITFLFQVSLDV